MSVTITELAWGTRKLSAKEGEKQYLIKGATDQASAYAAMLSTSSPVDLTFGDLIRSDSDCTCDELPGLEGAFIGTAKFVSLATSQGPTGSFSIQFDISGTQQKITQSITTVNSYKASGVAGSIPNHKGTIGVNEDGSVEGTDILVPTMTFTLNYVVDPSLITNAYVATLARTVGKVSSDAYKGFAAGELLLTKVTGQRRDKDNWDLSFGFAVSENATGVAVGDISGIAKKGWEYLWIQYVDKSDGTNHFKNPQYAFVEQVYKTATFATALDLP